MKRAVFVCALALPLLLAARARADGSVSVEAGGGESKPTRTLPPSAFEYQKLALRYEPTEALQLSTQLRLTHDFSTTTPGTTLVTGDDWVWLGALVASIDATPHLNVALGLSVSPSSTRDIASSFVYPTGPNGSRSSYAVMHASSSNLGATLDATYDTASTAPDDDVPERAVDATFGAALGLTRYSLVQAMTEVDGPNGSESVDSARTSCGARATPFCALIADAANDQRATLGQLRAGANGGLTFFTYTDLNVDFGYFAYDSSSPTSEGIVRATPARGGGQTATYGVGLPLIPPRWTLRGEVGHRWKPLSLRGYYQYTSYVADSAASSFGHTVGAKAQVYLGDFRVYATGSYRSDSDSGEIVTGYSLGLGVTWRW